MQIDVRSNLAQFVASMNARRDDVVTKAVPRALNRVAEMARTNSARELRADGYNFSSSEIKDASSLSKATAGAPRVTMRTRRLTKSLMQYSPTQTKAGVTVKVHGARKLIKSAFIGQLRNGRVGVYVEDKSAGKTVLRQAKSYKHKSWGGWRDYPVRKLNGPSVGGVYGTDRIQQRAGQFILSAFDDRLAQEIKYLSR